MRTGLSLPSPGGAGGATGIGGSGTFGGGGGGVPFVGVGAAGGVTRKCSGTLKPVLIIPLTSGSSANRFGAGKGGAGGGAVFPPTWGREAGFTGLTTVAAGAGAAGFP